ncbi:MAG: hypothetical protein Q7Q71_15155 [Verrucomicrobiota bacterium JB023]|nr:hypothetical protein [Verrucomicrobiota bacterium JB023]
MKKVQAELTTGKRELTLPIRMVSDWHLGHPASRLADLSAVGPYLRGAGTLVMVGDGREELVDGWRPRADALWAELQDRCATQGVEFVALTGNHDPDSSEDGWLFLDGRRILVTHGDMVYDTTSPWSRELFKRRTEVLTYLETCPAQTMTDRWQATREIGKILRPEKKMAPNLLIYAKIALWPPERLLEIGKTWAGFVAESGKFLDRFAPEVNDLVCGHFHRPGQFKVGQRTVWNTGSMMKFSRAMVVEYDGKDLRKVTIG